MRVFLGESILSEKPPRQMDILKFSRLSGPIQQISSKHIAVRHIATHKSVERNAQEKIPRLEFQLPSDHWSIVL